MLLIPTFLAPSSIHGIGLFTVADIRKGTMVWRWDASLDREIPLSTAKEWPQISQDFLEVYAYRNPENQTWMLGGDAARHINHSFAPNTQSGGPYGPDYALQDIKAGQELTIDYRLLDPDFEKNSANFI